MKQSIEHRLHINNSNIVKIKALTKIKGKDKGREMQTQGQHNDVLLKKKPKPSA